ncbi:MAG: radical SAM protein [Candidatus Omnitrophota bacterium]|nr:radical SAM protein [Candidatus Omnitrophota bacterium]
MYDLLLIKPLSKYNLQHTPSLGLGFIAGYLERCDYSVQILDCNVLKILPEHLSQHVYLKNYRLIGIQAYDMDLMEVEKYIEVFRREASDVPIVVGGPAPSLNPELVFKFLKQADFLVVGEGEIALEKLLQVAKLPNGSKDLLEKVPNLAWRDAGKIHFSSHEYVMDINFIGEPAWDLLNPVLYKDGVHGFFYRKLPVLPIMISRGCPFHCSFCGSRNIFGCKVRRRDTNQVLNELEYLKSKYGLREFQVIDDNFTFHPELALEFAEGLIARRMDLSWVCPNGLRLDTLNKKLLATMKASGCYEVAVGIESGDPIILKDMGKHLDLETIREKINLIYSQGINVVGFVMVGYPLETQDSLRKTIKFVLSLPLVRISLTRFVPMSGTSITNRLIANGEIKYDEIDPARLNYNSFSYIPPRFTERQLSYWYRLFFLMFLLRPRIIFHNIRNIRSLSHARLIIQKIIGFFK